MAGFHGIEKLADLTPDVFFFAADTGNRQKAVPTGVFGGKIFSHIYEGPDQPHRSLLRLRDGRQRRDTAIEKNVSHQGLGAVIGRVTEGEYGAAELGNDV